MKTRKYNFIYKITCLLKESSMYNHYYIGQHSTNNLDDGYLGSGIKIGRYIQKYGAIEGVTYKKEILAYCETSEELNELEYKLIGDLWENDPLCLNMKAGGNYPGYSKETRENQSKSIISTFNKIKEEDPEKWNNWHKKINESNKGKPSSFKGKHHKEESRKKISESHKGKHLTEECKRKMSLSTKGRKMSDEQKKQLSESHKGKNHTEETKKKISEKKKGKTGKIWINNGIKETQIRPEDISKYPDFERGRLKRKKNEIFLT